MPTSHERPGELRVGWVDGRLLASADLCDDADNGAWLRSRHVLGVHRTWGVVWGFAVYRHVAEPRAIVARGLAYDACGAELALGEQTAVPLPQPLPDGTLLCVHAAGPGCAALAWRRPGELRPGADVPLAVARRDGLELVLDTSAQRRAASQRRPVMAAGSLPRVPVEDFASDAGGGVLRTTIEFADAAMFGSPPAVFVSVRVLPEEPEPGAPPALALASVAAADEERFVLAIVLAGEADLGALETIDIEWLAVGGRSDTGDSP